MGGEDKGYDERYQTKSLTSVEYKADTACHDFGLHLKPDLCMSWPVRYWSYSDK